MTRQARELQEKSSHLCQIRVPRIKGNMIPEGIRHNFLLHDTRKLFAYNELGKCFVWFMHELL